LGGPLSFSRSRDDAELRADARRSGPGALSRRRPNLGASSLRPSERTLCYTKTRSGGGPHVGVRIHL